MLISEESKGEYMFKSFLSDMFPQDTPLKLLIQHADILDELGKKLLPLTESYFKGEDISDMVAYICKREHEADEIKFKLRNVLKSSVKVPFAIKGMLDYLHYQDDLIDAIEDIGLKMSMNRVEGLDDDIKAKFIEMVKQVDRSVDLLQDMVRDLKKIIDSSFAETVMQREERDYEEIDKIENVVDELSLEIGKWMYANKKKLNAIDLIFFREMVEILGNMTDKAENTAEILRAFLK